MLGNPQAAADAVCHLAHRRERRVTGGIEVLNQQLNAGRDDAVKGQNGSQSSQTEGSSFAITAAESSSHVLNVSISPVRLILSTRTLSTFSFNFSSSCNEETNMHIACQSVHVSGSSRCVVQRARACCVVARQYSAVLRMLQIRQSSSTVNFAASEPSFSFRRLLMVSPPVLLLHLKGKQKRG